MRKVLFLIALLLCLAVNAKTTYLPKYHGYLHIVTDGDTLSTTNNSICFELADPGGMFVLAIEHEEVTEAKFLLL